MATHHSAGSRSAFSSPLVLPVLLTQGGSLGLVACSSTKIPAATGEAGKLKELLVIRHSVTPSANDRILPRRFAADWKAKSGQELKIRTSSRGSGTQSRAIVDGLEADLATLALSAGVAQTAEGRPDLAGLGAGAAQRQQHHQLRVDLPHPTRQSQGNAQLERSGQAGGKVVTANPKTSCSARWNLLGPRGSIRQTGGSQQQEEADATQVSRNVENLPEETRQVFAVEGSRPTEATVRERVRSRVAPLKPFFSLKDFGRRDTVNKTFF